MTRGRGRGPLLTAAVGGVVALLVIGMSLLPVTAAARPYAPTGTSVTGGDDAGGASPLRPGVHTDTLARGSSGFADSGSVRYYVVTVRTGQTPYLAVTVGAPAIPPAGGQLGIRVSLTAQGASSTCATESRSDFATDDRLDPVTVVVSPGRIGRSDGCPAGNLVVRVERDGDALLATPLKIEIAYRLEPAASAAGLPGPAATDQPVLQTGLTGTPAALASGNSFENAPVLATGIYKDALTTGDTRIVRVHLDWGQRFAYAVTASAQPGVTSDDSVSATAVIRNPLRQVAGQTTGARVTAFSIGDQDETLSGSTAAPVEYRNRESDDDGIAAYANAGDYYLVLGTDVPRKGDTTLRYPYSLQIRVSGTVQPAPSYVGVAATTVAPRDAAGPDSGSNLAVRLVLGAIVLALVAVPVVVVSRRRRRRTDVETRQVRAHR